MATMYLGTEYGLRFPAETYGSKREKNGFPRIPTGSLVLAGISEISWHFREFTGDCNLGILYSSSLLRAKRGCGGRAARRARGVHRRSRGVDARRPRSRESDTRRLRSQERSDMLHRKTTIGRAQMGTTQTGTADKKGTLNIPLVGGSSSSSTRGTAHFSVYGLAWLIQSSFREAGICKISPKPKKVPSPFVPSPFVSFGYEQPWLPASRL